MNLFAALAARLGYVKADRIPMAAAAYRADTYWGMRDPLPDGSLYETQAKLYQRLSWVRTAVAIPSQYAAGVPFSVRRLLGEETEDIPNHPFEQLLQRPNPVMSRFEFLEATFAYRALTGNAYWWLNRGGETAPPSEIWVLPSHKMAPVPDEQMGVHGYLYTPGGDDEPQILDPTDVVHFKQFNPLHPLIGLSPIESLAIVAIGDLAAQQYNTNFFSKEHAKAPGALAFSDPISDADWERIKADLRDQQGGVRRNLMMLRNAGTGVHWIQMAMSQADMEFLASRNFTKEEIFLIFAPGLASVLAVNATEANSTAGLHTLLSMAIRPLHVAIAEKITNDLLPLYGEQLVGEFDDVRLKNREVDLQEQTVYERSHTIDEVRRRWYNEGPLGDPRGGLLVAEVQPGGGEVTMAVPQTEPTAKTAIAAEVKRWQAKALKRGAATRFESDVIPLDMQVAIRARLARARSATDIKAAFAASGRITADMLTDALPDDVIRRAEQLVADLHAH